MTPTPPLPPDRPDRPETVQEAASERQTALKNLAEWLQAESFHGFDREQRTFEARKAELLRQEGQYVVIQGEVVAGVWPAYEDALEAGYTRFGLNPFLVQQIRNEEPVTVISRFVAPCPT